MPTQPPYHKVYVLHLFAMLAQQQCPEGLREVYKLRPNKFLVLMDRAAFVLAPALPLKWQPFVIDLSLAAGTSPF